MRTLLQSGSQKVLEGLTTAEEVLRVTQASEHTERQLPDLDNRQ
jgi:hypothetical protein